MGTFAEVTEQGLGPVLAQLNAFADPARADEGLVQVGALIESQTKLRIQSEGPGPDGEPWPAWSPAYAATRTGGQSLLQEEGYLLGSIAAYPPEGGELRIGSNLVQAALQQFGGADDMAPGPAAVPARPYLGVSADNAREIDDVMADWMGGLLQ